MRIFQEEIFGQVVSVATFKDEAEAVSIANDTLYGLELVFGQEMQIFVIEWEELLKQDVFGSIATTPTLHTLHSVDIRILGSEEKLTK